MKLATGGVVPPGRPPVSEGGCDYIPPPGPETRIHIHVDCKRPVTEAELVDAIRRAFARA